MKKLSCLLIFLLIAAMLLTSCSNVKFFDNGGDKNNKNDGNSSNNSNNNASNLNVLPFPESSFLRDERQGVIGAIVQTGDGNAYLSGNVPSAYGERLLSTQAEDRVGVTTNKQLVTLEHNFGYSCYVSGYIGNSLYIIQDFGSLAWNKKGVGHKDGTVILEYGNNGYFSISSFSENKIIVGNPTDASVESLWDDTESYMFGYMVYNEDTKELTPLYAENNMRFYTAGYFINGVAQVSVKKDGKILFGIIDSNGNYVVEPKYEMMADESINNIVIAGLDAEAAQSETYSGDTCGRNIWYDSTLMTNVQYTRFYECKSQSVGLVNTLTGEEVLSCSYSYIERVFDQTYFVIDNSGAGFLYDAKTDSLTPVEQGSYSFLNNEWMLYIDAEGNAYLADRELQIYDATELDLQNLASYISRSSKKGINTNIISTERAESANAIYNAKKVQDIESDYDPDKRTHTIKVMETGDVIYGVNSFTNIYNGGFLYCVQNSLYRYDMNTKTGTKIETGFGNFTEDYQNRGQKYYTGIDELDVGVYILRYNVQISDGQTYLMIIVNDKGEVLFDTAINSVERLCKNYLGKYDDALYELSGTTKIEDNYFLTRDDGSHFLIQFVRGESVSNGTQGDADASYTRTMGDYGTFTYLSPFMLDFADGSEIFVEINGMDIPSNCYVYNSEEQSLKLLNQLFDYDNTILDQLTMQRFIEIIVRSGTESVTLRIEVSPFAFRF